MNYKTGGNMDRVYRMVKDRVPRPRMPEESGLTPEQVKKALHNLVYTGQIRKVEGTGGAQGRGLGNKFAEFEAMQRVTQKTLETPKKRLASVWDLATL